MLTETYRPSAEQFRLKEELSQRHATNFESVILFQELGTFLSELFNNADSRQSRLVTMSPAIADIAIAADKAGIELIETVFLQPFTIDVAAIKNLLKSSQDIIYLANPNRLTGATCSNAQIKPLAPLVSKGLLIIDEYYHDFSRLSAVPLLKSYDNVVLLRPLGESSFSGRSEYGFAIVSDDLLELNSQRLPGDTMERATARKCLEIIRDKKSIEKRVAEIQNRSLQVAKKVSELEVRCQLTPTNFILLQMRCHTEVTMLLNSSDIELRGFKNNSTLQNYVRYRITGTERDFKIVEVLSRVLKQSTRSGAERQTDKSIASSRTIHNAKSILR